MLTTEPARSLTDRELARVYGGLVGVLCTKSDVVSVQTATALAHRFITEGPEKALDDAAESGQEVLQLAVLLVSIARAWDGLGEPGAMERALKFYVEHAEAWAAMGAAASGTQLRHPGVTT